ncbi:hypothetical protein [uncultured Marinobacter sp.]|uniref:hypothetical protein n=1 Tax=uncultured Marinobacter sp. TaxID=187379 RepID=UPI0025CC1249|nr:hypothetical protein [uncultured Marinobacter sp.]
MKVELSTVQKLNLTELMGEPHKLDPVSVILENFEPGKGKIIIECYGQSWSAYWGGMGAKDIATFFCRCDEHYIAGKLSSIRGGIDDYEALASKAQSEVCQMRRDQEINQQEARELFDAAGRLSNAESAHDLDDKAMIEIFGPEWWYAIPEKPNPDYQYLCRIIRAVQAGIKKVGLNKVTEEPLNE